MNWKNEKNNSEVWSVILFMGVLVAGMVLGACIFFRPTTSVREKRNLTKFPEFKLETALNGEYWQGISTWYADTYPMRDIWLDINRAVQQTYGIQTAQIISDGTKTGDDIPVVPGRNSSPEGSTPVQEPSQPQNESSQEQEVSSWIPVDTSKTESSEESSEPVNSSGNESSGQESTGESSAESQTESREESSVQESSAQESSVERVPVVPHEPDGMADEIEAQIHSSLFCLDDAAYSLYYFSLENANKYAEMISHAADLLAGKATVYNVLVPNSTFVVLPEDIIKQLGCSDEREAISYYYAMMNDKVHTIDAIWTLRDHKDEAVIYRTDHHWTQLGAYYAYRNFCKDKGVTPHELSEFEQVDYGDFLGSHYFAVERSEMRAHPDRMICWIPKGTNEMRFISSEDGTWWNWRVIQDVSDWDIGTRYNAYIGGDNPFSVIENPDITDGSACVLIKESYGNAFAPWLVDHYQTTYVIDYRYYEGNIIDFVTENNVNDVILMNNISLASSSWVVDQLTWLMS